MPDTESLLKIKPAKHLNIDRLHSAQASYGDLIDAFARELTPDEIILISGASKIPVADSGGLYCGTNYT